MRHTVRATFAIAALLSLSTLAHAGPIRWGYRAEAPDGTVLAQRNGLTDSVWSDFFLPDPEQFGMQLPDPIPDNGLIAFIRRSEAVVTVIDERSGQSGSFPIYADFVQQYEIKPDGSLYPIYEGTTGGPFWPEPKVLALGGNTYSIKSPGGELLVNVTPGPASATPEPGSLALAAIGLGAVLARRLRRV